MIGELVYMPANTFPAVGDQPPKLAAALVLLGMTLVIPVFVHSEASWPVHSLWTALAAVLAARGGGLASLKAVVAARIHA